MEDVIKTRVEEGALPVTGKVMYCKVEMGSVRNDLLFGNMCMALLQLQDLLFLVSLMFDLFSGRVDWRIVKDIFLNEDLALYVNQWQC